MLAALTLLAIFLLVKIHHPFLPIPVIGRPPFLLDLVLLDYIGFPEASSLLSTGLTLRKMASQVATLLSSKMAKYCHSPKASKIVKQEAISS